MERVDWLAAFQKEPSALSPSLGLGGGEGGGSSHLPLPAPEGKDTLDTGPLCVAVALAPPPGPVGMAGQ